jgi:hypothetical protein
VNTNNKEQFSTEECYIEQRANVLLLSNILRYIIIVLMVTGKAIPLQALTGPEGSRRLRLPDFKTIGT